MTKLNWDIVDRDYYAGVDRAVLYLPDQAGVSWNGIVSIDEAASEILKSASYIDGKRYVLNQTTEEFDFKISAYTYPDEFDICCGFDEVYGNQPPVPFGMCYRTQNSTGHLLHLVYNAIAKPANVNRQTLNKTNAGALFGWDVSTTPKETARSAPSSHLVIDLTDIDPTVEADVLDILYGTPSTNPRLPELDELVDIFVAQAALVIVDNGDGTWTATGPPEVIQIIDSKTFELNSPGVASIAYKTYKVTSY